LPSRANGAARPISQNISRSHATCAHAAKGSTTARMTSWPSGTGQLSVGSATALPGDGSPLLALEKQFNAISAELLAVERLRRDQKRYHGPAAQSPERSTIESCVGEHTLDEIESVLARLHPIERAIMQTPARTMAGLSVKARHAAYVTSQYWEAPIDKLDWDARAVRLLIEAVCDFVRTPLPFRNISNDE
jgi:hypothetical protein